MTLRPVCLDAGPFRLRPWRGDDAAVVLAAYRDPEIRIRSLSSVDDLSAATAWIDERIDGWRSGAAAAFAVIDPTSGAVLGNVRLRIDHPPVEGEVGYWTLPAARGRRVASTALDAVSGWAFGVLGLARLRLIHAVTNPASCRVADRGGFRFDRELPPGGRWPTPGHLHLRGAGDQTQPPALAVTRMRMSSTGEGVRPVVVPGCRSDI
ncbi:GNAT family N-acetyltransferase [Micromonospora sp. RTP1Z1]|uniref:GNAT family N-acetyltransferase n=1 Tax=Micromonospora sp. RTP1Z1 TaxID=2994043 RepID=UPI0029C609DF|nr:GNAT family N-acetyltransferase [Micromonospora sp. RTP1Z1]